MHRALEELKAGRVCQRLSRVLFGEEALGPPDKKFCSLMSSSAQIEQVYQVY